MTKSDILYKLKRVKNGFLQLILILVAENLVFIILYNLVEFFYIESLKHEEVKKIMILYGCEYDENSFSAQKKAMYCRIMQHSFNAFNNSDFEKIYKERNSILNLIQNSKTDYPNLLLEVLTQIKNLIIQKGVYNYDLNRIADTYIQLNHNYFDACYDLEEQYEDIADKAQQSKDYRQARKAHRGRWIGGGFGITGALSGAAKAGLMNMASGIAHSAVNAVGNATTDMASGYAQGSFYSNPEVYEYINDALRRDFFGAVYVVEYILNSELNDNYDFSFDNKKMEEAEAIAQNIKAGEFDSITSRRLTVDLIVNKVPYLAWIYQFAENMFGPDNGNLKKFAEFFSMDEYAYGATAKPLNSCTTITINCYHCNGLCRIPRMDKSLRVNCPHCGKTFICKPR